MTEQSQNTVFRNSSFLQGQNGEYIERLQARYAESPASVDPSWQAYFKGLDDATNDVLRNANGPTLSATVFDGAGPHWPSSKASRSARPSSARPSPTRFAR